MEHTPTGDSYTFESSKFRAFLRNRSHPKDGNMYYEFMAELLTKEEMFDVFLAIEAESAITKATKATK